MAKVTVPEEVYAFRRPDVRGNYTGEVGKYHLVEIYEETDDGNIYQTSCRMIIWGNRPESHHKARLANVPPEKLCRKCFWGLIIRD